MIAHGMQIRLVPGRFLAIELSYACHTVRVGENCSSVEGIDPKWGGLRHILDDKMPRQPHTHDGQPHLSAKVQIDDGQRNGDAGFALQDVVQEAIARVIIVLLIAVKAQLVK